MIFFIATLYSSVGHAGASAYIAAMALVSIQYEVMKPSALILNLFVASIGIYKFHRAGFLPWKKYLPFGVTSVPFAYIGSSLNISSSFYEFVVGSVLIFAAYRLFQSTSTLPKEHRGMFSYRLALLIGICIGLVAGIGGTGGGIFLTPVLVLGNWVETREAAGITVLFVFSNSVAGLIGDWEKIQYIPDTLPLWILSAGVGGWIGATYGSHTSNDNHIKQILSLIMVLAGIRLIFA